MTNDHQDNLKSEDNRIYDETALNHMSARFLIVGIGASAGGLEALRENKRRIEH